MQVMKADEGNARMRRIGEAIREGSNAFLRREYMVLAPFVVVVAGVIWGLVDWYSNDQLLPRRSSASRGAGG